MPEKYKPSEEEIKKAEETMTEEHDKMSTRREQGYEESEKSFKTEDEFYDLMNKSKLKLTETRYIHKPDKFYKEPFPMEPRMAETQEIKGDVAGHLVDISRTRGITVGQNDPYLYIGSVDDRKIDVYLAKKVI